MRMRRPLLWVALLLVIIAAIRLETGGLSAVPEGMADAVTLGICQEMTVTGQVYKKDDQTIYLQDIYVRLEDFEGSIDLSQKDLSQAIFLGQNIPCKDNIICKLAEAEKIPLGSYVTLLGNFAPISPATNPGEFDAAAYYQTIGVGGRLSSASLLAKGQDYWPVREWLYHLRLRLEERLYRALPESRAGILCALLLGDKGGLEKRVKDLYRQSGILHILSISSLHITILGMSLYRLLRYLRAPVGLAALAGSILLLSYGCLTGFGVSACRAIGMYLIRMLGEVLGRTYDMLTALGVMGALMVWQNPYYLHHSGFLLSYASVLGVGVLYPALTDGQDWQGKNRSYGHTEDGANAVRRLLPALWEKLQQSLLVSLSVALATLPVQLWCYYEVPVYSVFLNLFVLPFVKPLMLSGLLAMLIPGFGLGGIAAGGILAWYEWLCELCSAIPFHTWNPGCPSFWQILLYYLMLGILMMARKRLKGASPVRWAATGVGLICAVLLIGLRLPTANSVTFLDVGQGDCILVQTGSGENYLFDCGSTSRMGVGEYVLVPFLKYNGIRTLDAVFVSHPDADHANGISELLALGQESGVEVRQLILPDIAEELRKDQMGELINAARMAGQKSPIEIRYISTEDVWECGSARFTCLNPAEGWSMENENAYSECFYVEFFEKKTRESKEQGTVTMLLTGDVEGEGEEAVMHQLALRGIGAVDILKVAHHGSRGATSEEFLELIRPGIAVISCGSNNRYGHPHPELLKRLEDCNCRIYRTQECGAVTVRIEHWKVRVQGFY